MAELDRIIKRGNVYWIRGVDSWGSVTGAGRPGVVVSSQFGNDHSPIVQIVYCTTQLKQMSCNVDLRGLGKPSQAQCNQIATIDKGLIGNRIGEVSESEMSRIDEALAMCLGLTIHKRELDEALETAKAQIAGLEEELLAKNVEIAMAEKMYDKALEMLAGVHLTKDLQSPVRKKTEVVAPKVPRIVPDEPEIDEEIEVRRENDRKVNVNTASAKEIRERTGLPMVVVYNVTAYRKQNGPFGSLEDLLKTAKFTEYHLREYGEMLTV